jgi:hypothetical protein
MSESETIEYQSHELVQGIVKDWVKNAADTARTGSGHPAFDEAINQMQHLYLAEPWLITEEIFNALKLSGWTAPGGSIEVDYTRRPNAV